MVRYIVAGEVAFVDGLAIPALDQSQERRYQKLFPGHSAPPVVYNRHSHCCARLLRLATVAHSDCSF
jgi:hypothetical protein